MERAEKRNNKKEMTKEQKGWIKLCRMLGLDDEEFEAYFSLFYLPKPKKKEVRKNANTSLPGRKVR